MIKYSGVVLLLLITVLFSKACTPVSSHIKVSPQFHDGKFINTHQREGDRSFSKVIRLLLTENWGKWPEWIENTATHKLQSSKDEIVLTFINHATFLVEVHDLRILFDPIFSDRASPVSWIGPKRKRHPGVRIDELPPIDLILISHNHYDHLDLATLKVISTRDNSTIVVPLGDKEWLENEGIDNVYELDWWQNFPFDDCTTIHFVPAQHSSGRGLFDRDESLWGGFVVEHSDITLFHAGDTGYSDHFKKIGARYDIDVAMLPIGSYAPEWFLGYVHMNPEQAVQAHQDIGSSKSFGMHSETFSLSAVDYLEAEDSLQKSIERQQQSMHPFTKLKVGESVRLEPSNRTKFRRCK